MSLPTIQDPSFETPALAPSEYRMNPAGSPWTFTGSAGLAGPTSGYRDGSSIKSPDGAQMALLQNSPCMIAQAIDFPTGGTYQVTVVAQQRQGNSQQFTILIDGAPIGTFRPTRTTNYNADLQPCTSDEFTVAPGSHTLAFAGDDGSGDNTILLDSVAIALADADALTPELAASIATLGIEVAALRSAIAALPAQVAASVLADLTAAPLPADVVAINGSAAAAAQLAADETATAGTVQISFARPAGA